jgi:HEAT repeat protein
LDLETSTMMTLIKKYHDPYLKKEIMRTLVNYQRRRVQTVAEAKEPVLEAIHDKDDVTRLLAHRIVYNYMPEEDWRSIYLTSLEDPSPSIRALSANSLAMYQNPKVVTPLIKALQDADFRVQKGAVYSLAYHKNDERALMAIAGYIAANGQGADYASEQFINQIIHTSQRVDKKIHATWKNDSAATALLAAFDKANGDGKKKMLVLLRELDDERVVKLFKSLLDDPNPEVRKLASESFEELSATDIYPLVLSKLKDKDMDMEVRQRVLNDLWGLRDRHNIMEPLLEMIKDKDPGVRMSALTVLQKFTDNPPVDQFLAMVDDPDKNIRLAALHAIGNTNDPRATDISLRMLKEKDWVVRDHAAQIIIQKKDPRAVAPLIELLNHDDGEVAARAASLLGVLGDLRAVSPLIEALDGRFNKSRPMTVNRRPGDLYLRDNSAQALGKMKEKSAVPHLIKILSNPNEDISLKAYVARALRMIGDPSALGALRKVVESGELGTNQFYNNEVMDAIEELSRKEGR